MLPRYSQAAQRAFSVGAGKNVGFIGLGCMGLPMSQNLKKAGFNVTGYDLSPDARATANDGGIQTAETLTDLCKNQEYIVTALPQTAHVEDALKQEGGIFDSAADGTLICDVSTIHPDGTKQFYADAKA